MSAVASPARNRLRERYAHEIAPKLMEEFGLRNPMQVPRIEKAVVNVGIGEATQNPKALDAAANDLSLVTGQKPLVRKARKSVAAFRLRAGASIGLKVTLRGVRMYEFLDRLFNAALPRIRDFRGLSRMSFDGRGNYTLGLREQLVFPEIDYDKIDRLRGLEISIVTSAPNNEQAIRLLELMGLPFERP